MAQPVKPASVRAPGSVRIRWRSADHPSTQVRVSEDGGSEKLFAAGGATGSATASFIAPGHSYVFALYSSAGAHSPLASTVVKEQ